MSANVRGDLPQELINRIIEIVGVESKEALSNTSLVSRSFYNASLVPKFEEISLDKAQQPRRLLEVLKSSPKITSTITSLIIAYNCLPGRGLGDTVEIAHIEQNMIAQILHLLHALRRLHVMDRVGHFQVVRLWTEFSSDLRTAMELVLSRSALKELILANIYELPPCVLHRFHHLTRLELQGVNSVEQICRCSDGRAFQIRANFVDVQVRLGTGRGGIQGSVNMLYPVGFLSRMMGSLGTVPHLSVTFFAWMSVEIHQECSLARLGALRSLKLTFHYWSGIGIHLERVLDILRSAPVNGPLDSLTLDFTFSTFDLSDSRWREFEIVLEGLANLRFLTLKIREPKIEEPTYEPFETMEAGLLDVFNRLSRRVQVMVEGMKLD